MREREISFDSRDQKLYFNGKENFPSQIINLLVITKIKENIHTHVNIYTYIYIYIQREREREREREIIYDKKVLREEKG